MKLQDDVQESIGRIENIIEKIIDTWETIRCFAPNNRLEYIFNKLKDDAQGFFDFLDLHPLDSTNTLSDFIDELSYICHEWKWSDY